MHRVTAAQNFSAELKKALDIGDEDQKLRNLGVLSQYELNYLQAIQFDRALAQLNLPNHDDPSHCRIAILSSSTVDHLLPALRVAAFRLGIYLELFVTPFGQYRQELLQSDSALARFEPHVILFSLSARDILSTVSISATASEVDERLALFIEDLKTLWQTAKRYKGTSILQQTFLNIGETLFGSLDRVLPGAPSQVIRRLNEHVVMAAAANEVLIMDLDRPVERDGLQFWFDNAKWLQAKIEISPIAAMQYADLALRIIAAQRGLSKKCVVVDLDNTLWGGVIGDDGIDNIALGQGSGLGEAYLSFQQYLKLLKERGVLLAVCSKNEQKIAESVFVHHPEMVLRLDDITSFVANWNDKASNLIRIAEQLNIGLDSLVFVDDNPAERALIRQSLPMVAVPELPDDASEYVSCLSNTGYFESVAFTADDAERNLQYASNEQRKVLEVSSQTIDDYLASLRMTMSAEIFSDVNLPRISQLVNKTNQFNTTTRRKTLEEIQSIAAAPRNLTLQVRLTDRFGDNGLVSAVIMEPVVHSPDSYEIETWVMSCRVFGRQLEYEILNSLVMRARAAQAKFLFATYRPTPKNALIRTLFADIGFEPIEADDAGSSDETRWKLDLLKYSEHSTHIEVRNNKNGRPERT